jgi:hypothetical protein
MTRAIRRKRREGRVAAGIENPHRLPADQHCPAAESVIEHLNWRYIQLGLVAHAFGGLQMWWGVPQVTGADLEEKS